MLSPGANATGSMADTHEGGDLAAVLSELQSLRTDITSIHDKMSDIAGFGDKLDKLEERISDMNNAVTAVQGGFTALKQDISANATRLNEAEDRIESAEESVQSMISELTAATKRIAYLETKTEDLENRGRRKNLRLVGLAEGTEGTQSMLSYIQHKMPLWLGLDPADTPFTIERAHRTLGRPKPGQNRAVLIRFLRFQDREVVFLKAKQRTITHEGHTIFFAQDFSAETMKKRSQFNAVKKQFVEAGSFRGFQLQPCKMRIFHNGKIVTFSTPEEAENFRHK
uniref:L1 transposable element RRM domain-containing protein n=1 Tax=Knipowitschia caucasica TaxID=637954 RepID=A0AAV2LV34_KNICA